MKRMILALTVTTLILSSCATSRRAQVLPFSVIEEKSGQFFALSLTFDSLTESGYRIGDWVQLDIDGVVIHALIADSPHHSYPTVVRAGDTVQVLLPSAFASGSSGTLRPSLYQGQKPASSVSLSGSFVFTF